MPGHADRLYLIRTLLGTLGAQHTKGLAYSGGLKDHALTPISNG